MADMTDEGLTEQERDLRLGNGELAEAIRELRREAAALRAEVEVLKAAAAEGAPPAPEEVDGGIAHRVIEVPGAVTYGEVDTAMAARLQQRAADHFPGGPWHGNARTRRP